MKIVETIIGFAITISLGWFLISVMYSSIIVAFSDFRKRHDVNKIEKKNIEDDWHNILHVSPNSSTDEIKHAYRKRMSEYHPDKTAQLGIKLQDLAKIESQKINAAYEYAMSLKK